VLQKGKYCLDRGGSVLSVDVEHMLAQTHNLTLGVLKRNGIRIFAIMLLIYDNHRH
jgi:hypothetical protein